MSIESSCTVIPPGGGEAYWVVGDHITFKLGPDATRGRFSFAETTVAPGGGPPPHVHHREDELFYILDGTFGFIFNGHTLSGSTGDAFYLPKDIIHTFKNVGIAPGRLLVGTAPTGFEAFIPEAGCPCDGRTPAAPPLDDAAFGKLMAACARYGVEIKLDYQPGPPAPRRAADREYWVAGSHVRVKLDDAETGGLFTLFEAAVPRGGGYPPHQHRERHDVMYVLEGSLDFDLAGRKCVAPAGTFIHVPPGATFSMANNCGSTARLLDCVSPGGFEKFFEEAGVRCVDRAVPPPPVAAPPEAIVALFAKHGMTLTA